MASGTNSKILLTRAELEGSTPSTASHIPTISKEERSAMPPTTWPKSEFPVIFDMEKQSHLPEHRPGWDFDVEFKDNEKLPRPRPLFRLPPTQRSLVEEYIGTELKSGKLRPSNSPVSSNLFFVPKGDSSSELRPTVDYRDLNSCTKGDQYPLPPLRELVASLAGGDWYAKLDWRWAYNNIRIKEGSEWKFAIKCHMGLFEPLVMPFGPKQAPSHMQRFVNETCKDFMKEGWLVNILDDFVIKTVGSVQQHINYIKRFLQRLQELNVYVKESKCKFFEKEIDFVGFRINKYGYRKQPQKLQAIQEWGTPKNAKDIRSFMAYVNFYRTFAPQLSTVAVPLFRLTTKKATFKWKEEQEIAFRKIKQILIKEVFLLFPKPDQPFYLCFDSSELGTGAVLQQKDEDGNLRPIEFFSKKWNAAEYNYFDQWYKKNADRHRTTEVEFKR
ncbi:hypothetical protein SeLEV6574_g08613 [Synchytrium endobioticum]|uniref:Reverse transcriptase domain-containing protein n=1 Tax=Synchytrium endobioticum TaxID=286115 RepID=A0A507BYI0_9FUNG|nr:hypothetical protein SeLEV6574_g08613 [Synchytrium endobioticum]